MIQQESYVRFVSRKFCTRIELLPVAKFPALVNFMTMTDDCRWAFKLSQRYQNCLLCGWSRV